MLSSGCDLNKSQGSGNYLLEQHCWRKDLPAPDDIAFKIKSEVCSIHFDRPFPFLKSQNFPLNRFAFCLALVYSLGYVLSCFLS